MNRVAYKKINDHSPAKVDTGYKRKASTVSKRKRVREREIRKIEK